MGKGGENNSAVNSLMGNLSTKIFHANSDSVTNEYASRLIGSDVAALVGVNEQKSVLGLTSSRSQSLSSHYLPQVHPREFTMLASGGITHNYNVEAYIIESGRKWSEGKNFLFTSFKQNFKTNQWIILILMRT